MRLNELLDVDLPIIQAPMAGVQDSALGIAVARAGGLGSLPCAMLSIEQLESELSTINRSTSAPINLNFCCHQPPTQNQDAQRRWLELLAPYFLELNIDPDTISQDPGRQPFSHAIADAIEPFAPPIISFHFGLPSRDLVNRLKTWGATILSSATTVKEALWLEANGADLIIAQGLEAGGHRAMFLSSDLESQKPTNDLLEKIARNVELPIIAAGGIGSCIDVANAISRGAVAAQVGTAYLLCDEAKTSLLHRNAIQINRSPKTTLTNIFSGRPARGIINRAIKDLGSINSEVPDFPLAATAISALRGVAETNGSSDFTPLWCGENTQGCEAISAYELTIKLASTL